MQGIFLNCGLLGSLRTGPPLCGVFAGDRIVGLGSDVGVGALAIAHDPF